MAEYPLLTEDDGTTPAAPFVSVVQAGDSDGPTEYWAVNDPGSTNGDAETISGSFLRVEGYDGAKWVVSGLPFLDDRWVHATIFGTDCPVGEGPIAPQSTGSTPLGAGTVLELADIPQGCARKINLALVVPGSANPGVAQWRVVWVTRSNSLVLNSKTTVATGVGVVPGYRTFVRQIVEGLQITADGSDTVVLERGIVDFDHMRRGFVAEDVLLNQNAADGALVAAQSYVALISKDAAGVTVVTKSNKGAAPVTPDLPADSVAIGAVTVAYDAGGSMIDQADVDQDAWGQSDLLVVGATGLSAYVYPGSAVGGDRYQFLTSRAQVALVDDDDNYVWLLADGTLVVTQTLAAPGQDADLLAIVTTVAGVVTAVQDQRNMLAPPVVSLVKEVRKTAVLSNLVAPLNFFGDDLIVLDEAMELEEVTLDVDDNDGWDSGAIKVDVIYWDPGEVTTAGGTTIYTSSATDDARPFIAFDAIFMRSSSKFHEVRSFPKGARLAIRGVQFPVAAVDEAPHQAVVQLHFRRTR